MYEADKQFADRYNDPLHNHHFYKYIRFVSIRENQDAIQLCSTMRDTNLLLHTIFTVDDEAMLPNIDDLPM